MNISATWDWCSLIYVHVPHHAAVEDAVACGLRVHDLVTCLAASRAGEAGARSHCHIPASISKARYGPVNGRLGVATTQIKANLAASSTIVPDHQALEPGPGPSSWDGSKCQAWE